MKISEHFDLEEFACKCGECKPIVSGDLINLLEEIRKHFQKPVIVNSGFRCKRYNAIVGGKTRSKHIQGLAADIVIGGVKPSDIADYVDSRYPDVFGIGRYKTFTHVDVRRKMARWVG